MKTYASFFDDVLPELPGCTTEMALHHIKRTCNDFYERSLFGREECTPQDVVAGTSAHTALALDVANFEVSRILEVRLKDSSSADAKPRKLDPRSKAWLDQVMPDWDTQQGTPKFYTQNSMDTVVLAYIPVNSLTAGLQISIAKVPLYTGTGVDDGVFSKFSESIAYGIKSRLMRMPKKPWSNDKLAADYARLFEGEVAAAAAIATNSFGRGVMRTKAWG
jgi:hypothetical protein